MRAFFPLALLGRVRNNCAWINAAEAALHQSTNTHPTLAKPNYQFEKRKRDNEKKAKKEEKRLRKLDKDKNPQSETTEASPAAGETN